MKMLAADWRREVLIERALDCVSGEARIFNEEFPSRGEPTDAMAHRRSQRHEFEGGDTRCCSAVRLLSPLTLRCSRTVLPVDSRGASTAAAEAALQASLVEIGSWLKRGRLSIDSSAPLTEPSQ